MKAGRVIVSAAGTVSTGTVTPGTVPDFGTVPANVPDGQSPTSWTVAVGSDGRATVDGEALVVVPGPGPLQRITRGGGQVSAHVTEHGGQVWVHVAGDVYLFDVTTGAAPAARPRSAPADELSAPMPATVRAVLVGPGDRVAPGDTLLMLEAMKMELPIRASREGRVKAVHCQAGELVQPGVPLVEIE